MMDRDIEGGEYHRCSLAWWGDAGCYYLAHIIIGWRGGGGGAELTTTRGRWLPAETVTAHPELYAFSQQVRGLDVWFGV
eukprot:SAG25_NODE_4657_length_773_cov_1.304154_2_plen_79_part_00